MNADAMEALADRLFAAIEAGDVDAVRGCYAPDAAVWHNFDQRTQNVEQNLATLGWMCRRLSDRRYDVTRRAVLDGGLLQLHVLRATVTATGAPFELPAAMVLTMADDRITRIEEYLDPTPALALGG